MNGSTSSTQRSMRPWIFGGIGVGALIIVIIIVVLASGGNASSNDGKPTVTLTPAPSPSIRGGQVVGLSVGPNKYFAPYSRIEILECADPGGQAANLPVSDLTCDGNTAPGFSVLVNKDGSFSTNQYQIYSLPNAVLGEPHDNQPTCNASHQCVLYVGQDQTNFHAPKVFSAPFTVAPPGPTSAGPTR